MNVLDESGNWNRVINSLRNAEGIHSFTCLMFGYLVGEGNKLLIALFVTFFLTEEMSRHTFYILAAHEIEWRRSRFLTLKLISRRILPLQPDIETLTCCCCCCKVQSEIICWLVGTALWMSEPINLTTSFRSNARNSSVKEALKTHLSRPTLISINIWALHLLYDAVCMHPSK